MLCIYIAQGQGCSDAGFCTAGALGNPAAKDSSRANEIAFSLTVGRGEQQTIISIPQISWKRLIGKLELEVRLPYYFVSGDLGSYSGIGDPIVSFTRPWRLSPGMQLFATAGTRFSLTDAAGKTGDGQPLPMPYQRGLGTADAILGISLQYRKWLFVSAGYQQPVFHYNRNGYLAGAFPMASEAYRSYFDSRMLRRSGDMLLRADYMHASKRWMFAAGPLLIYHLGDDRITLLSGRESFIAQSGGLTANITARAGYTGRRFRYELSGGAPFIFRDRRPDGLTRKWVITAGANYRLR